MSTIQAPTSDAPNSWQTHVAGQDVRIFVEVEPFLQSLLADIRTAQKRIWVETYILGDDSIGRAVTHALAERAAEGIDVRLMIDGVGSVDVSSGMLAEVESAGGKTHVYHSFGYALWEKLHLELLNWRNHRKLVVIDDSVAYFGGMNLADPVAGRDLATWHDIQMRVGGTVVDQVAEIMDRLWRHAHGESVKWPRFPLKELKRDGDETFLFFDTIPIVPHRRAEWIFRVLIRGAKQSINLLMAYFVPSGAVLRDLFRMRKRGVHIRVVVPALSDVRVVQWATEHLYGRLLRRGFRLFERTGRMLHSKAMVVDDKWTLIGSCNLDPRSLLHNREFIAVIRSPRLAKMMNEIVRLEVLQSERVTRERVESRTMWQRWRGRLAWWFRAWL